MIFARRRLVSIAAVLLPYLTLKNHSLVRAQEPPKICLILYLLADNDLESAITNDLFELYESEAIIQPNLNTWIYYDSHGSMEDYVGDIQPEHPLVPDPTYFHWDRDVFDLIDDTVLPNEVNSDDPQVLCNFLARALGDCVSNGAEEYILSFSSHGGGHQGYGGDENPERRRGRSLVQSNSDIVSAIECGLGSVPGSPEKFDVIGFDACLMGSFLTTRDYSHLTKYYLSSEAVEPAHGWWWNITNADNALSMALELHDGFLEETQNPLDDTHLVPKTLSIVDTSLFENFHIEFETFFQALTAMLLDDSDQEFFASIQRSRAVATAFESVADQVGSRTPSAVDIGSFLSTFDELCSPSGSSSIKLSFDRALAAYNEMFTARGYGIGTKPSTGMAIYWPSKQQYYSEPWNVEDELWYIDDGETSYAYLDFVRGYLNSTAPSPSDSPSVCTNSLTSQVEAEYEGQLLLNPVIYKLNIGVMAESDIAISTDIVITEYGFYIEHGTRRRLADAARRLSKFHNRPHTPLGKRMLNKRKALAPSAKAAQRQRAAAQDDSYAILFNGALPTDYDGPKYSGFWNEYIYIMSNNETDTEETYFVYADNRGEGAVSIPVVYLPPDLIIDSNSLPPLSTVEEALAMGGVYGELEYTIDESTGEVISPVSLYTTVNAGDATGPIYEKSRNAGGSIVPVVYGEAGNGEDISFLEVIGSFHQWDDGLEVFAVELVMYADFLGLNAMVFDMYAIDLDLEEGEVGAFDLRLFDYHLTEGTIEMLPYVEDESASGETTSDEEAIGEESEPETPSSTLDEEASETSQPETAGTTSGCNRSAPHFAIGLGALFSLLFN